MPEVKRREIQRRKNRRERLWRDDDDNGDGSGGGGALKRAAKKILVKQLKELREREARLKREAKKSSSGSNTNKDVDDSNAVGVNLEEEHMAAAQHYRSSTANSNGALAAGFTLDDNEMIWITTKQL